MKRSLIFASRNIKEILRDPLSLVFLLALPFIMLILFYYLFNGLTSQFEIKYFEKNISFINDSISDILSKIE